jgi:hypothetical protein
MDRFDDQDYKDVIGLVELYKLRSGKYPASLDVIRFEGEWDMLNQETIHYELKSDGYLVNVHGMEIDTVQYPDALYVGLGIVRK